MSPLSPVPLRGSVENLRPLSNLPLCLAHETHTLWHLVELNIWRQIYGKTSTNESANSVGPSPKRKSSYCFTLKLKAVEYLLIENRGHGCEDQSRTLWSSKLHGSWGCGEFLMSSLSITISNLEWYGFVISCFFHPLLPQPKSSIQKAGHEKASIALKGYTPLLSVLWSILSCLTSNTL